MAVLPFGLWDVGDSFHQAVDFEEEEQDQFEMEDESIKTNFDFVTSQQESISTETLILSWGDAANAFIETYFDLPNQPIAELIIHKTDDDTTKKESKRKKKCSFYKVEDSILCSCQLVIKPEDSMACVEKILSNITCKRVSILCSSPKSHFEGNDEAKQSDMDILRSLASSTITRENSRVPQVEEGNIIDNLPAAALSYCEQFKLACILYINYTESHYVDVFSLKTFEEVLKEEMFEHIPTVSHQTVKDRLKTFEGIGVADNNLYI